MKEEAKGEESFVSLPVDACAESWESFVLLSFNDKRLESGEEMRVSFQ